MFPRKSHCALNSEPNMKKIIIPAILLLSLTLFGCKPKETTLSGQVFIVTKGGENIKLGLVEVQLLDKQQVKDFLQKMQPQIDLEIASRKREYDAAKTNDEIAAADFNAFETNSLFNGDYAKLKARCDKLVRENDFSEERIIANAQWLEKLKADVQAANNAAEIAREADLPPERYLIAVFDKSRDLQNFADEYKGVLETIDSSISTNRAEIDQLHSQMEQILNQEKSKLEAAVTRFKAATLKIIAYPVIKTYFSDFSPVAIKKTATDADGKFSFTYPRDTVFTLFATSQRMVGDKTENYCWLVNAPNGVENAQIFLSNNNLVFVDPDSYFKIKPVSDAP